MTNSSGEAPQQFSLRFVILRHDGVPEPHFDLMFETAPGGPLETWRSPAWPIASPVTLTLLAPHRRAYLTYEGPVSNNRGVVTRVAEGTYDRLAAQHNRVGFVLRFADDRRARLRIDGNTATIEPAPTARAPE
jgi:hypothetical protein